MKKVCIIVPYHKNEFGFYDKISVQQLFQVMDTYPIVFACPKGVDPREEFFVPGSKIIFFETEHFESADGYNSLCLSSSFYERFLDYEYILIAQTDSFVFQDRLMEWCEYAYDYVGAPWTFELSGYPWLSNALPLLHRHKFLSPLRRFSRKQFLVGNGGFSLRKTKTFYRFAMEYSQHIIEYKAIMSNWKNLQKAETWYEDIFWSLYAPLIDQNFKIPEYAKALTFAFEVAPSYCYRRNGKNLPFGCHAWMKHDPEFWKPFISSFGHEL